MTEKILEKANEIKRTLDKFMRYESFSKFIDIDSYPKTTMRIEISGAIDIGCVIDEDDTELMRELFKTMKEFSEKRIKELNHQFAEL